jgi:putative ABC transport system ATP-binding protein
MSLACRSVTKSYADASPVLVDVSLELARGDTAVVFGPSGSGKTTLLSILGCLQSPTTGEVRLGEDVVDFGDGEALASTRRTKLGFVFQQARLLPFLTVADNVRLVAENAGLDSTETRRRLESLADALQIAPLLHRKPSGLSGGESQRVAIARALVHRPTVVLADEPTAALDWRLRDGVVRLLLHHAETSGATVVMVTHDESMAGLFRRVLRLERGVLRGAS